MRLLGYSGAMSEALARLFPLVQCYDLISSVRQCQALSRKVYVTTYHINILGALRVV
jgi:hypothetical protein